VILVSGRLTWTFAGFGADAVMTDNASLGVDNAPAPHPWTNRTNTKVSVRTQNEP
jgi:hypothetical protein